METEARFAEILERAGNLPLEDQETLVEVLQNRMRDSRRAALAKDIEAAQKEFQEGSCRPPRPRIWCKRSIREARVAAVQCVHSGGPKGGREKAHAPSYPGQPLERHRSGPARAASFKEHKALVLR